MKIAVCSLVRGRERHLENFLRGLAAQHRPADAVIVSVMQPDLPRVGDSGLQVIYEPVDTPGLPLGRARNVAARRALDLAADAIIFLDVDCIAEPDLIGSYEKALMQTSDACLMGETRYLGAGNADKWTDFETLWARSERHPAREFAPQTAPLIDEHSATGAQRLTGMSELWGLSFALPLKLFVAVDGFDTAFDGYGGEETDFAARLADRHTELFFIPRARAVHQWHPVMKPPLNHFDDIIRNARLFQRRHGRWCMDYWLGQFTDAGLVEWRADRLDVLRHPTDAEIDAARQPDDVRFS